MKEPESLLPEEPFQEGPLPKCRVCRNNALRTRRWRIWRVMHCPFCGGDWRERLPE